MPTLIQKVQYSIFTTNKQPYTRSYTPLGLPADMQTIQRIVQDILRCTHATLTMY